MADSATTPSKPKGRHQYSKSETPSRAVSKPHNPTSTPPAKGGQGRRGRNRNHFDHNQQLPHQPGHNSDPNLVHTHATDGAVSDTPATTGSHKKGRGRQRHNNNSNNNNSGRGSPPKHNEAAQQSIAAAAAATPAKDGAYAGPAFHASPAPSALPMPKFFSRSVPSNTAPAGLQSRLDQESDSSDKSDKSDSPSLLDATPSQTTPVAATPAQKIPPREHQESPLDFFFKADREEKARKNSGLAPATPNTPHGKSPLPTNGRNHHRHESNNGRGIFVMETEGGYTATPKPASPSPAGSRDRIPANRSVTAPSSIPRTSPAPSTGAKATPSHPAPDFHTPSPFYQPTSTHRMASNPHTPTAQIDLEPNPYYYGNRNLSPLFQAAKGDSVKRGSGLRQVVDSSTSVLHHLELPVATQSAPPPVTPTRPTAGRPDASAISRNFLNAHIQQSAVQDPSSFVPYQPQNNSNLGSPFSAATGSSSPARNGSSVDAKTMENDLRRLLKLQLVDT